MRLDPQSNRPRARLQRVTSGMAAEDFRRWMAEGFKALNAEDLTGAQARFHKAKALRPEAPEVAEALARRRLACAPAPNRSRAAASAATAEQRAGLDRRRGEAYEEALGMERALQFAQQEKTRRYAVTLERCIAVFVSSRGCSNPTHQLENAARLLQDIQARRRPAYVCVPSDKLGAMVQPPRPGPRELRTDSLTEVSVYRVGRLAVSARKS